jgi:hypothetical protein
LIVKNELASLFSHITHCNDKTHYCGDLVFRWNKKTLNIKIEALGTVDNLQTTESVRRSAEDILSYFGFSSNYEEDESENNVLFIIGTKEKLQDFYKDRDEEFGSDYYNFLNSDTNLSVIRLARYGSCYVSRSSKQTQLVVISFSESDISKCLNRSILNAIGLQTTTSLLPTATSWTGAYQFPTTADKLFFDALYSNDMPLGQTGVELERYFLRFRTMD